MFTQCHCLLITPTKCLIKCQRAWVGFFCKGLLLLFKEVDTSIMLRSFSTMRKLLFVYEWDPGGFKQEGKRYVVSISLCCMQAEKIYKSSIANSIELSPVLKLFHAGSDSVREVCVNFLLELVRVNKRTFYNHINVIQSSKNLEEKILATLVLKTFINHPIAHEAFRVYAKSIHRILRKLRKYSIAAVDIMKALLSLNFVDVTELWSCGEVVELDLSSNGEVLSLLYLNGQFTDYEIKIVGHSLGGGTATILTNASREGIHMSYCVQKESSRMSLAETHHKQWDPGEHDYVFYMVGTSGFQLWDPGGLSLLFTNHLEDKVNFKGESIDENLKAKRANGENASSIGGRKMEKSQLGGGPLLVSKSHTHSL